MLQRPGYEARWRQMGHWLVQAIALVWLAFFPLGITKANPLLLVDMRTSEVLVAQDAGLPWYPASLVKLATAFVTFRAIENGRVSLTTPVIISARAAAAPPGKAGLRAETAITMQDALNLLIVKSANDVAIAIAETVSGSVDNFVGEMNEAARVLGLGATNFTNPHGLFDAGQVSSARDMAVLSLAIRQHYPRYASIFATSVVRLGEKNLRSNNNLLTEFAGTSGMKTGFICSAGLNMVATVERNGRQFLAVVLGASSARERGELAAKMVVDYLSGTVGGSGQRLAGIGNETGLAPVDMRPRVCGAQAQTYVAERNAAFPFGINGEPSFLADEIAERSYTVNPLGRIRVVTLPRPRPAIAPRLRQSVPLEFVPTSQVAQSVPLPRPRPHGRVN